MDTVAPCCPPRRRRGPVALAGSLLVAGVALVLPSCGWDGHFTILGYTTRPNYDTKYKTVRVPIFKNLTMRDSTREGLEFQLTQAVIREIGLKTPYRVVGGDCDADTELTGTITAFTKVPVNRNQLNEVREAETVLGVQVTWQDLRSGEYLSRPRSGPGAPPPPPPPLVPAQDGLVPGISAPTPPSPAAVPVVVPPPGPPGGPPDSSSAPVMVYSQSGFIPELGQSNATAYKQNVDRMAVQIVSLMEVPW